MMNVVKLGWPGPELNLRSLVRRLSHFFSKTDLELQGQKRIFAISRPICIRYACNQRQNVQNSIINNMVCHTMWWCAYLSLSICLCMYVCFYSYNSESTGRNLLKFGVMIGHDPKNNRLVLRSDWVKVTKRSKTNLVTSRSKVTLAEVCALRGLAHLLYMYFYAISYEAIYINKFVL